MKSVIGTLPAVALKLIKRPIFKEISRLIEKYGYLDNKINKRIIRSIPNSDNVIIANVGTSSMYYNPDLLTNKEKLNIIKEMEEMGISKDNKSILSYMYSSVSSGKKLIVISSNGSTPALAHEVGHLLIDLNSNTKFLQSRSLKSISRSESLKSITSFCLALFGKSLYSYISSLILSSPQLASEFLASKIGYDLIKNSGASDDQLNKSIRCFSLAWSSYILWSVTSSLDSHIKGSLLRILSS